VCLFEVAIFRSNGDSAMEEEQHIDPEFAAETYRKPGSRRLRSVDGGEAEAWQTGAQKRAHGEWNVV